MKQAPVQSASYRTLLQSAAEFLASFSPDHEVLVLARTRGAADDFVRAACGSGRLGVHRTTLTGLALEMATPALSAAGLAPLTGLAMEAMVARVIHHLRSEAIPYFEPVASTPGLARAVSRSIAELRMNAVTPEVLAAAGAPGRDLARMMTLFKQELAIRSVADFPSLVRYAIGAAIEGRHRLLGLPVILLDVDPDSRLFNDFLEAILEKSPAVCRAVLGPGDDSTEGSTLDRVRRFLFAEATPAAVPADGSVAFFSAAGESLECVEIARRIAALAAAGVAFDRTAILLRSPERYQPMVEEALRRAEIPAYFSRGVARPDPAGRAFLALLACAGEGCSATRFAEYLSLGQAPRPGQLNGSVARLPEDEVLARLYRDSESEPVPESAAEPPEDADAAVVSGTLQSPAAWEKLLVDAAVIGGRERWERRLRGLEEEFKVRLAELGPKEHSRRPHLLRELTRLKNLENFALPLIERLAALPRQASWGEWIAHLRGLAEHALRQPASVLALLEELQAMDEVGPVGLDEVSGVLRDRLRFLRSEPPRRRYGQVFVGGIEEARGRVFDFVFLPGLCEGLFPARAREDPILLDVRRRVLNAALRLQDDRVADERRLLRVACAAAGKGLVFSYPRVDAVESRPRVPSFYALEIVRAAQGCLPDLRAFEDEARRGAPSRLDWPAPEDPSEAIDSAEFDLAALGRSFALPAADARATGRYLMDANAHLVRSLYAYARRSRQAWSYADGLVNADDATRASLAGERLASRSYSPSALQHYAACPYRFLLHAIHKLHPREEKIALEQIDPLTRGALFHEAQFRLFRELQSAGLLPMRAAQEARIVELSDRVLDAVARENEEKLAPAIPRVWHSEIEDLRNDLRGWIRSVVMDDAAWVPLYFEYSFGLPHDAARDPASTPAEAILANGTKLRGAIDLIERHEVRGTLRITDHKTGKPPQDLPKYVAGGAMLQPLAYAMAAEALLDQKCEISRLSYCTGRGGYQEIPFEVSQRHRAFFQHAMSLIDGEIARGFLPVYPQRGACDVCDYHGVCGPNEERRTAKKHTDEVDALQQLRNIP